MFQNTCQTAWCYVVALLSSCRLQNVLPEMRCQTELIMHLSLQAERVLIQNLHVPFSRAGPGYLAHCLPPRPSLYPDPSAQVCRHGTILLRAFRSTTNGASHVLCVTVNEGSQSGPAEASVTCSNPNILCMLANANLAVSLPHIIWLLGVFRGGCDFRPANGDHSISAHTHQTSTTLGCY